MIHFHSGFACRFISDKSIDVCDHADIFVALLGKAYLANDDGTPQRINSQQLAAYIEQYPVDVDQYYTHLSGRFVAVVYHRVSQQTLIFNDPLGIQPCYYSFQQECLYISDSLKKLKQQPNLSFSLSRQAIYHYFYFHCIPSPLTIYQQSEKLAPGSCVTFASDASQSVVNLYRPDFAHGTVEQPDAKKQCLTVIEQAVKRQITDDCGAFLSGGLDSSTVAGMLTKHQSGAKTFSIGFDVAAYDESAYAKITAEHFHTDHHTLYLKPEQAVQAFVKVAQYFDEPFGNSSAMAAYFCADFAKQNGVTHLLAGDGGDELFAGNERYAKQKVFESFHQAPASLQFLPRLVFKNSLMSKVPVAKKVASYIRQADIPLPDRLETYNFIHQFGAEQMFEADFLADIDSQLPINQKRQRYAQCTSDNPVDAMLYLDWKFTLADNDLVKVNKMCELAGVEVDYPLLDRSLVDFSCTVPAEVKLPGNKLRDFYKNACEGFLPDATLTKSKHGFGLPFGVWIKENKQLAALTDECLVAFAKRGIVKQSLIDKAVQAHKSVHAGYYGELIWIMVILELWLQGQEQQ